MAGYEEIRDMYEKGITLQSGVYLTKEDLWEINHIYRIKSGMDSYEYVSEQLSVVDNDYDFPEIEDTAFYEEINDRVWDTVTAQDEADVVIYMVREYKKQKEMKDKEERVKARDEIYKAVENLQRTWRDCVNAFSNAYIDCNDYIVGSYPFNISFDDIDVENWCDDVMDKIAKEIDEETKGEAK